MVSNFMENGLLDLLGNFVEVNFAVIAANMLIGSSNLSDINCISNLRLNHFVVDGVYHQSSFVVAAVIYFFLRRKGVEASLLQI